MVDCGFCNHKLTGKVQYTIHQEWIHWETSGIFAPKAEGDIAGQKSKVGKTICPNCGAECEISYPSEILLSCKSEKGINALDL